MVIINVDIKNKIFTF